MALRELQTVWTGVGGAPHYTTVRALDGGATSAQDLADAWIAFLQAIDIFWVNNLTATVQTEVRVVNVGTGALEGVEVVTGATVPGVSTADQTPRVAQCLIQWRTAQVVNGRFLRGRTFLPGFNVGTTDDDGTVDNSIVAAVATEANDFVTALSNDAAVWSRTHGVAASISLATVWDEFAFMRSRRD